jgi:hypothetical protein
MRYVCPAAVVQSPWMLFTVKLDDIPITIWFAVIPLSPFRLGVVLTRRREVQRGKPTLINNTYLPHLNSENIALPPLRRGDLGSEAGLVLMLAEIHDTSFTHALVEEREGRRYLGWRDQGP